MSKGKPPRWDACGVQGDTETALLYTCNRNLSRDPVTTWCWATDKLQRNCFDINSDSMRGIGQNLEQWKISRYFFHILKMALALQLSFIGSNCSQIFKLVYLTYIYPKFIPLFSSVKKKVFNVLDSIPGATIKNPTLFSIFFTLIVDRYYMIEEMCLYWDPLSSD